MKRITETWQRHVGELGPLGLASLVLIALALLAHLLLVQPLATEVEQLRSELLHTRSRLTGDPAQARGPHEALQNFYSFFPAPRSSPLWLGKIYEAAQNSGVQLISGEYQFERPSGERLGRYRLTLPVQGSYEQLREFIAGVLEAVPAVSLDDVTLRREDAGSPLLDARLRLTLYLAVQP